MDRDQVKVFQRFYSMCRVYVGIVAVHMQLDAICYHINKLTFTVAVIQDNPPNTHTDTNTENIVHIQTYCKSGNFRC